MRIVFSTIALLALLAAVAPAQAQGADGPLRTRPPDEGFGQIHTERFGRIPDDLQRQPLVDRRFAHDPLADQGILTPRAATAPAGHLRYTTLLLLGHGLSWSPSDTISLGAGLMIPSYLFEGPAVVDFGATLHGRFTLHRGPDHALALMPLGLYRAGAHVFDTAEAGVGLGLLFDFIPHDRVLMTAGAIGYVPLWAEVSHQRVDPDCPGRNAYIRGECFLFSTTATSLPPAGHWLALYLAATIYGDEHLSMRLEAISGLTHGSFLDLESALENRSGLDRSARPPVFDGPLALGLPMDRPLTLGVGAQYALGRYAVQVAFYGALGRRQAPGEWLPDWLTVMPVLLGTVAWE